VTGGGEHVHVFPTREEQAAIQQGLADRSGLPGYSEHEQRAQIGADEDLVSVLGQIALHDTDYDARYELVFRAVGLALASGLAAGIRDDPAEPGWPVVYIELPTGQVSWHMPQHPKEFDGHTTEEKYKRVREFAALAAVGLGGTIEQTGDERPNLYDPNNLTCPEGGGDPYTEGPDGTSYYETKTLEVGGVDLAEVRVLRLQPDDALVLAFDRPLNLAEAARARAMLTSEFPGHRAVVTTQAELLVVRPDVADQIKE
jgi:hypothetical protein